MDLLHRSRAYLVQQEMGMRAGVDTIEKEKFCWTNIRVLPVFTPIGIVTKRKTKIGKMGSRKI